MRYGLHAWASRGVIGLMAMGTVGAASADRLDPVLAEHPVVGALYVQSFQAAVRIPEEFRGEWSRDPSTCGVEGDDGDARLTLRPVTVHFGDETHVATRVARAGPHAIDLAYGPLVDGYHFMIAPPRLSLSPDGQALMGLDAAGDERLGRWTKCPTRRPPA